MPRLTRVSLRLALVYLALGFTLGALMLANEGLGFWPWLWNLLPVHIAVLVFGWMVQLALGVAYWILPRRRGRRGSPALAWGSVGLLNLGLLLACAEPLVSKAFPLPFVVASAFSASAVAFALHALPRLSQAKG